MKALNAVIRADQERMQSQEEPSLDYSRPVYGEKITASHLADFLVDERAHGVWAPTAETY